jgi:hypothetical protein
MNVAPVVLSDCETRVGLCVSKCRAYSITLSREPPTYISLVHVDLSGRDGAEGPSTCGASGLHS